MTHRPCFSCKVKLGSHHSSKLNLSRPRPCPIHNSAVLQLSGDGWQLAMSTDHKAGAEAVSWSCPPAQQVSGLCHGPHPHCWQRHSFQEPGLHGSWQQSPWHRSAWQRLQR